MIIMKKMLFIVLGIVLLGTGFVMGRTIESNQEVEALDLFSSGEIELLNLSTNEVTDETKFQKFLELQETLFEAHETLAAQRETFKENRLIIQDLRTSMRENSLRPSYEDGITLWTNYHTLLNLKDSFAATQGEGYQKLKDLKGFYDLEHIDLIIQTYEEVLEVLTLRQNLFNQGIIILEESITLYQTYLNV
jgi:hypothetical protein